MERLITLFILLILLMTSGLSAATVKVDVIKNPYAGARNVPELSTNPDYIHAAGLEGLIEGWGGQLVRPIQDIRLDEQQERQYGEWHRMALANSNFAAAVRRGRQSSDITVGLEANCNDLLGMLAGLKYDDQGKTYTVGLVFIDAHGDFNIPETTLSGMLGGMPVAIAAGHALHNLRRTAGLAKPLTLENIVWGGVRDLDPLEAARFDKFSVNQFSVDDVRNSSDRLASTVRSLSSRVDIIYVHVDMDVLDPAEVGGHPLTVPDGPTSIELASAIKLMFADPKVVALGIASTPAGSMDIDGKSRAAALNLIEAAIVGVQAR